MPGRAQKIKPGKAVEEQQKKAKSDEPEKAISFDVKVNLHAVNSKSLLQALPLPDELEALEGKQPVPEVKTVNTLLRILKELQDISFPQQAQDTFLQQDQLSNISRRLRDVELPPEAMEYLEPLRYGMNREFYLSYTMMAYAVGKCCSLCLKDMNGRGIQGMKQSADRLVSELEAEVNAIKRESPETADEEKQKEWDIHRKLYWLSEMTRNNKALEGVYLDFMKECSDEEPSDPLKKIEELSGKGMWERIKKIKERRFSEFCEQEIAKVKKITHITGELIKEYEGRLATYKNADYETLGENLYQGFKINMETVEIQIKEDFPLFLEERFPYVADRCAEIIVSGRDETSLPGLNKAVKWALDKIKDDALQLNKKVQLVKTLIETGNAAGRSDETWELKDYAAMAYASLEAGGVRDVDSKAVRQIAIMEYNLCQNKKKIRGFLLTRSMQTKNSILKNEQIISEAVEEILKSLSSKDPHLVFKELDEKATPEMKEACDDFLERKKEQQKYIDELAENEGFAILIPELLKHQSLWNVQGQDGVKEKLETVIKIYDKVEIWHKEEYKKLKKADTEWLIRQAAPMILLASPSILVAQVEEDLKLFLSMKYGLKENVSIAKETTSLKRAENRNERTGEELKEEQSTRDILSMVMVDENDSIYYDLSNQSRGRTLHRDEGTRQSRRANRFGMAKKFKTAHGNDMSTIYQFAAMLDEMHKALAGKDGNSYINVSELGITNEQLYINFWNSVCAAKINGQSKCETVRQKVETYRSHFLNENVQEMKRCYLRYADSMKQKDSIEDSVFEYGIEDFAQDIFSGYADIINNKEQEPYEAFLWKIGRRLEAARAVIDISISPETLLSRQDPGLGEDEKKLFNLGLSNARQNLLKKFVMKGEEFDEKEIKELGRRWRDMSAAELLDMCREADVVRQQLHTIVEYKDKLFQPLMGKLMEELAEEMIRNKQDFSADKEVSAKWSARVIEKYTVPMEIIREGLLDRPLEVMQITKHFCSQMLRGIENMADFRSDVAAFRKKNNYNPKKTNDQKPDQVKEEEKSKVTKFLEKRKEAEKLYEERHEKVVEINFYEVYGITKEITKFIMPETASDPEKSLQQYCKKIRNTLESKAVKSERQLIVEVVDEKFSELAPIIKMNLVDFLLLRLNFQKDPSKPEQDQAGSAAEPVAESAADSVPDPEDLELKRLKKKAQSEQANFEDLSIYQMKLLKKSEKLKAKKEDERKREEKKIEKKVGKLSVLKERLMFIQNEAKTLICKTEKPAHYNPAGEAAVIAEQVQLQSFFAYLFSDLNWTDMPGKIEERYNVFRKKMDQVGELKRLGKDENMTPSLFAELEDRLKILVSYLYEDDKFYESARESIVVMENLLYGMGLVKKSVNKSLNETELIPGTDNGKLSPILTKLMFEYFYVEFQKKASEGEISSRIEEMMKDKELMWDLLKQDGNLSYGRACLEELIGTCGNSICSEVEKLTENGKKLMEHFLAEPETLKGNTVSLSAADFHRGLQRERRGGSLLKAAITLYVNNRNIDIEPDYAMAISAIRTFRKGDSDKSLIKLALDSVKACEKNRVAYLVLDMEALESKTTMSRELAGKKSIGQVADWSGFIAVLKRYAEQDMKFKKEIKGYVNRVETMNNYQKLIFVKVLQNRSMLDYSQKIKLFESGFKGIEIPHIDEDGRRNFSEDFMREAGRQTVLAELSGEILTTALGILCSYQISDTVDITRGTILTKENLVDADRKTTIDVVLLKEALKFVEELQAQAIAYRLTKNPVLIMTEKNKIAYENYKKDHETVDKAALWEFLKAQARSEEQKAYIYGYKVLDGEEEKLFLRAIANRRVLDISKEGTAASGTGLREREYLDEKERGQLIDEYVANRYVMPGENLYENALQGLFTAQLNDKEKNLAMLANSSDESGKELVQKLLSKGDRGDELVDWKLFRRGLQLVERAESERKTFEENREIYLWFGDLAENGKMGQSGEFLRKNITQSGTVFSRFLGRQAKAHMEDKIPEVIRQTISGLVTSGLGRDKKRVNKFVNGNPGVETRESAVTTAKEKVKEGAEGISQLFSFMGDCLDAQWLEEVNFSGEMYGTLTDDGNGWLERLGQAAGQLGENLLGRSGIIEKTLGEDTVRANVAGAGYAQSFLSLLKTAVNGINLERGAKDAGRRETTQNKMLNELLGMSENEKERIMEGVERHRLFMSQAKNQASARLIDQVISTLFDAAGSIADSILKSPGALLKFAIDMVGKVINMIRSYGMDVRNVKEYLQFDNFEANLKRLGDLKLLDKDNEDNKEMDENDKLKLLLYSRGFKKISECARYIQRMMVQSLLFCASKFNTLPQLKVLSQAIMISIGVQTSDEYSIENADEIVDKLFGGSYQ